MVQQNTEQVRTLIEVGTALMLAASLAVIFLVVYLHRNIQKQVFRS